MSPRAVEKRARPGNVSGPGVPQVETLGEPAPPAEATTDDVVLETSRIGGAPE